MSGRMCWQLEILSGGHIITCMHPLVHAYMHAYIDRYKHAYTRTNKYTPIHIFFIYLFIYLFIFILIFVFIFVFLSMFMFEFIVFIYTVYIYAYTYTYTMVEQLAFLRRPSRGTPAFQTSRSPGFQARLHQSLGQRGGSGIT